MGCVLSNQKLLQNSNRQCNSIVRGKPRVQTDPASEAVIHDSKGKVINEYDALAFFSDAAANSNLVALTDYRGVQVYVTNLVLSKVNSICRWVDSILEVRERNGGYFIDPKSEASSMNRWENQTDVEECSATIVQESNSSFQHRFDVSTCGHGASTTFRPTEKSPFSPKKAEYSPASSRNVEGTPSGEKLHYAEKLCIPEGPTTVETFSPVDKFQATPKIDVK
ncbi:hypothetical protein BCY84_14470 [Trypanosoma cruzi cruzi]|uniref:Uncharacterized protein n=1 Tax=Trypanosoma cruzi TaxID=5693 RepID=A0A2V2W4N1_TRYCR|nr:hypothetical protein TcBrA4_0060100 [Trypanosoma cruzi]PBJ73408.1 hypothetical protein BCY84_14470 [Trypanosoma cruzi cruzi]PWV02633.1 hypothetical protein C4B63_2g301 [Trypanosoma cruzi]